ncbi:MAG: CBS domain-containing protein [Actinobacteria bacterium]|nr:CBS domain-containing protein [Actinomycetota bacterium]
MFERIDYARLRRLLDGGARLVEVLPPEEYAEAHLPGAINIPLKALDADSTAMLNKQAPVVVYCWDYLCDMSPRAAARLDSLGFERVYDYAPSKVDYLARGAPIEGQKAGERRAIDAARDDVVRCLPGDPAAEVAERTEASPYGFAIVVTADQTVLGRLRASALPGPDGASAEELMEPGPSTIRADVGAGELRDRLRSQGLSTALVTNPEGSLLGVVLRADL